MEVGPYLFYSFFYKYRTTQIFWQNTTPVFIFSSHKLPKLPSSGVGIHQQNGQRDIFTRGLPSITTQNFGIPIIVSSPLTPDFFQTIAFTHRSSLMMQVWGLLKWKRARKTLMKTILTKFERS